MELVRAKVISGYVLIAMGVGCFIIPLAVHFMVTDMSEFRYIPVFGVFTAIMGAIIRGCALNDPLPPGHMRRRGAFTQHDL